VIAAVHGVAYGLAIDIMSACDIRYASEDSKLSIREIEIGMAADIGTLQRLPKIVNNIGWLKEISFTGRVFGPREAEQQGLVNQVFATKDATVEAAIKLAANIAEKSPVAVFGVKKSINYALDHSISDSLEQIAEFNAHGLGQDFITGIMAALSKEKAVYPKL
jgi:delta(3,5)-delta(2,4)-dienoyl-CoA isomerase